MNDDVICEPRAFDEPVMVNVTHMDRGRYFESVRARAKSGKNLALAAGGVAAALIGLFMANRWIAVLGIVIFALTTLSPALVGRRDFRRLCERHPGGEWEKTLRFYADRVESDSGDGRSSALAYGSIRRECASERMYILDPGTAGTAVAFEKDGFVKGSFEECRAFLTEARREQYAPEKQVDQQGASPLKEKLMKENQDK